MRTIAKDNYWFSKIGRPIIGLAPMHQTTTSTFRLKCRKVGADVVYSEMVAAEAIIRRVPQAFEMMKFKEAERPILIQIFGVNPKSMAQAAKIIEKEFRPDGIDINFGCPVQKAAKQGFGAIQLADPEAAAKIVRAVARATNLPVSVKMRLPSKNVADTLKFVEKIAAAGVKVVAIHGRTPTQKFRGQADWAHAYAVKKKFPDLIVLGNGDISSKQNLKSKVQNLDGVLVGRAAKREPAIFRELVQAKKQRPAT